MNAERQQAAAQIQRSLKAWRAANGAAGKASVPKSVGSPLSSETRQRMEPKLGADLSRARIHTGSESAEAARGFGARAFTVGDDVHFNSGEFAPGTKDGDRLLAHELTHVVQGQKSGIQRKSDGEGDEKGAEVSDPAEPAEKEADSVADGVADELHSGAEEGEEVEGEEKPDGDEKGGKQKGKDEKAEEKAPPLAAKRAHSIQAPLDANTVPRSSGADPLADLLKTLGSSKPDVAATNVRANAGLEGYVNQFQGLPGFKTVIQNLHVPNWARDCVHVLAEASKLKAAGMTLQFELNDPGVYDVDVAAVDPSSGVIHCYAAKQCNMKKFATRVTEAARQLLNYNPAGATTKKIVMIKVTDGTDDDYVKTYAKGVKLNIAANPHVNEWRLTLASGKQIKQNGDL